MINREITPRNIAAAAQCLRQGPRSARVQQLDGVRKAESDTCAMDMTARFSFSPASTVSSKVDPTDDPPQKDL